MRRRRPQLTVSLFPFLSVLLCTLGSLILLLLVLDQKARQQRADEIERQHAAARLEAERLHALAEAKLSELHHQAQERLNSARRERDQLVEQASELTRQQFAKESALRQTAQELGALEQVIAADRRTAGELGKALQETKGKTGPLLERKKTVEGELARLMEQVGLLEQTVRKLQVAAQQPRPTLYSLVPYRGRLGTARRPIYVECVGQRVFFRPDGGSLFLTDLLEPGRLQREIEERFRRLPGQENEKPYTLLLIRPSGIALYYGVLRSLQEAAIDLGYEFIEEDWALDFTEPTPGELLADARADERPLAVPNSQTSPGAGPLPIGGGGGVGRPSPMLPRSLSPHASTMSKEERGVTQARGSKGPKPYMPSIPVGVIAQGTGENQDAGAKENQGTGEKAQREAANGASKARPSAPRPVGGTAQRDVPIVVECRAEKVILHPQKTSIPWEELTAKGSPLLEAVLTAVERRQQSPGLAQPQLRYLIRPDGLRTYYRASALLEPLRLRSSTEMLREGASVEEAIP
jgi:F0F1-type ATP synthase membrane subunit b/b'